MEQPFIENSRRRLAPAQRSEQAQGICTENEQHFPNLSNFGNWEAALLLLTLSTGTAHERAGQEGETDQYFIDKKDQVRY